MAISKFGAIRLGGDEERPDYPFFTWIGMLFSAGFGVGLVFLGCRRTDEPLSSLRRLKASSRNRKKRLELQWAIRSSTGEFLNGRFLALSGLSSVFYNSEKRKMVLFLQL